nr:cyclic nucleotide-binding domain-containing protein [uncultured Roseibium sp.]
MEPDILKELTSICDERRFPSGHVLRYEGGFAGDMLLVLEGEVEVRFEQGDLSTRLTSGRNTILGEIGFLTGSGASARVETLTNIRAIGIGRKELDLLETRQPDMAAAFSRYLAKLMRARLKQNDVLLDDFEKAAPPPLEVFQCNTEDLILRAQRLRYDVYCGEFGRPSPYADHEARTLIDPLDEHGTSFIAVYEGEDAGTARVNLAQHGGLSILPELYGMGASEHHPHKTCVITKYAIPEKWRGGATYMRIFAGIATFVQATGIREIYIDCVPDLARFYATMKFRQSADEFVHYENGLSVPMVLDVAEYHARIPIDERLRRNRWR